MNDLLVDIVLKFVSNVDRTPINIEELNIGLINKTYKVEAGTRTYILQRLNTEVFHQPEIIQNNFRKIWYQISLCSDGRFICGRRKLK